LFKLILEVLILLLVINFFLMFLGFTCLTIMLANKPTASINTLYEGEPHMLNDCMGLATTLLEDKVQAAFNAAFFMDL